MKLPRRRFLHLAAGAAALPAISRTAKAQAYPTRPVHLIVPYAPGGTTDITARLVGPWLSERLGQTFVIESRPGAATNVGTESVAHSSPDGYTLLLFDPSAAINATLFDKLKFQFCSRHCSHRSYHAHAFRHRGQPIRACQNASRVHRLCQGPPRQNHRN